MALDQAVGNVEQFFQTVKENVVISDEEIIGIQEKKKEYINDIETKMKKFKQHYDEQNKQAKETIQKSVGKTSEDENKTNGLATVQRNNRKTNQAKLRARNQWNMHDVFSHGWNGMKLG